MPNDLTTFSLVILTLAVTILFSFVPERYLKPSPVRFVPKRKIQLLLLQSAIITLLFFGVTLIVQRMIFAGLAVSIFLIILSGVSNAKYQALREPLVYSDIAMFSQAFKHPRLYFPFLGFWPVVIMTLVIVGLITALLLLETALPYSWQRLGGSILICVFCFYSARSLALRLPLSEQPATDNTDYGLLNMVFSYFMQARSPAHQSRILKQLEMAPFTVKGNDNSQDSTETVLTSTPPTFSAFLPKLKHPPQHIIAIQSESFFDARRLSDQIKPDVLAHYDACLNQSLQHGTLQVPAWGANTMRTEFSFLTGLHYSDMGLYRYYPYQFLRKLPVTSIASALKTQGYHCVCIHPHPASFFGRDQMFPQLGFDEFIDDKGFAYAPTFGPYIADSAVTDKILTLQEQYRDKPLFVFAITMENHGPLHLEKTTPAEQDHYFYQPPLDDANDLTVYLRHLQNADTMVQQLTDAYQNREQATSLCFYGDHIPSMPNIYQALDYTNWDADYFIWRNHAGKESFSRSAPTGTSHSQTRLAVADLAPLLLNYCSSRWAKTDRPMGFIAV